MGIEVGCLPEGQKVIQMGTWKPCETASAQAAEILIPEYGIPLWRRDHPRRVPIAPRLHPGADALLQVRDDFVGDASLPTGGMNTSDACALRAGQRRAKVWQVNR